jgi:excisionase family DNA binding protein
MAHPAYLRQKARTLRIKRKLTIDELAERLALSRSTIYYWVRDLPIPRSGSGGGWPASAHAAAARSNRRKHRLLREAAYRQGSDEFAALAVQPGFRDFVCLYIAEGYKRNRNRVQLSNSDEAVVRIATVWIARLSRQPLRFWIQFHADQDLSALRDFWSRALGIAPHAIHVQRKSNSAQLKGREWRSAHGVLSVHANDTYLRARLQAWIDQLRDEWGRQAALNSRGDGA